jgi:hypothetical protein
MSYLRKGDRRKIFIPINIISIIEWGNLHKKGAVAAFILLSLILPILAKPQSITQNSITITSDKEFYNCLPIYNDRGECLIRAVINVTNLRGNTINLDGEAFFSSQIDRIDFKKTYVEDSKNYEATSPNSKKLKQIQLRGGESYITTMEFWVNQDGKFNYSVSAFQLGNNNYLGTAILDPYYHTTNLTSPRAEFNYPSGESYIPNTIVNISADALDYHNISSVIFEIEKPNGIRYNISSITQPNYWTLRDENESSGTTTNNFATYFGDLGTSYIRHSLMLYHFPVTAKVNRIALEVNDITGSPQLQNFIYNISVCETNVAQLTASVDKSINCVTPYEIIGEHIPLSEQIGASTNLNFALIKLNKVFAANSSKDYILAFDYVSGANNGAQSDFWSIRAQAFLFSDIHYGRILSTNATFFSNLFPNLKMLSDYTASLNDTLMSGRYNITMFATDFHGNLNTNSTYFNILPFCNWSMNYTPCNYNDTSIKYYDELSGCGSLSDLPSDNGTAVFCDYCMPSLTETILSTCAYNGSEFVIESVYNDSNYSTCCAITGLFSDCPTDYAPFNDSIFTECVILQTDFMVMHPEYCEFDIDSQDKCYMSINLNTTSEYDCLTHVRTLENKLIQTNPPYTAKTDAIVHFRGSEYEDRQFFTTKNGIANVYFTKEDLIFDNREYLWTIECSNGTDTLITDVMLEARYSDINAPTTRFKWYGENTTALLLGGLFLLIFIVFAILIIKRFK